ncbi:MAG: xerC 3, partial [Phycisphaerales bacterium]|nr:xerC 3 [Phycisphaerales bacterium]
MANKSEDRPPFRLFRQKYRDRSGMTRESARLYVEFRDHTNRRHRWPLFKREKLSEVWARRIVKLVDLQRHGDEPDEKLARRLQTAPPDLIDKLVAAEIVNPANADRGEPLAAHLNGRADGAGNAAVDGFRQHLGGKRSTPAHVEQTLGRIQRVFEGCGLTYWRDIARPGADARIETFLGGMKDGRAGREDKPVGPGTINYYIAALHQFGRWMVKKKRATTNLLAGLSRVNAGDDADDFRILSAEETAYLIAHAEHAKTRHALTGPERAIVYRFAFESGFRPLTIRGLKVAAFDLDADPPTVTAKARTMKRRKPHVQALRAEMAADLKALFANRMPEAAAFRLPSKFNMARMIQVDAAEARAAWICDAVGDLPEQFARHRSDFLAHADRAGRRLGFYSLRHSHGTAMADAGVPQKDIAGSLHHTKTATTDRYVRSGVDARARAVAALPDVRPPESETAARATGTDGRPAAVADGSAGPSAGPTGAISMESGG